ncbi:hypothetical protein QJ850_gp883 [Acanthamoeba polyphaga mimivirus]|uniref:Uncharacterized protein n=1 Tax=Acanthamoeba polyphaga mimivirus Kroon TaxID=3069720 RepID=A0A0G2Y9L3_9VIRU|nr:hypothetical protein QJ850_gp883 [Acanthamoeba polyphaga mimivirus]AKI79816.1 hypothetical protein [Acanthamoeba polyphaga mimivirus Kroon]
MNRSFLDVNARVGGSIGNSGSSLGATASIAGERHFSNGSFVGGNAYGTYQRIDNLGFKASAYGGNIYIGHNLMHDK